MELLSEDDLNLKDMTPEELGRAWDLWFTLAQATNDFDPPYSHGVFVWCTKEWLDGLVEPTKSGEAARPEGLSLRRGDGVETV